jgi:L-proline amide hydrolase
VRAGRRRREPTLLTERGIAERYHVLGHSWGGMLAKEHALEQPRGPR